MMDNVISEILDALEKISTGSKILNRYINEGQAMLIGDYLIRYKRAYGELPEFPNPALFLATKILTPIVKDMEKKTS